MNEGAQKIFKFTTRLYPPLVASSLVISCIYSACNTMNVFEQSIGTQRNTEAFRRLPFVRIAPHVQNALESGQPIVALESTGAFASRN